VRLLFTNSDVLLSHPDFNADLRGALVASTYPLYPKNQHWSFPEKGRARRLLFPGQAEQGYYNATVALLRPALAGAYLEHGQPFPMLWPEERRTPGRP